MTEHDLKVAPPYFDALFSGAKSFEVRRDDRGFEVGDTLLLREWGLCHFGESEEYTGHTIRREITYVLRDAEAFGVKAGFVVLGLAPDKTRENES